MANGNIQYVYDHKRFYSRALRAEKNNKQRQQKNQLKLARKCCQAIMPYFAPKIWPIEPSTNAKKWYSGVSLVRIGNK